MMGQRWELTRGVLLAAAAGFLGAGLAVAQEQPGLSSGSGQGTGTGFSSGVQRNRSGSMSGTGPSRRGIDRSVQPPREGPPGRGMGLGPGVNVRFPNDPYLIPFVNMAQEGGPVDPNAPSGVSNELVKNAKLIDSPDERSLALQRIANSAIASNQVFLAHQILEDAVSAAVQVQTPLVRDQRLIAIVTSLTILNGALLGESQQSAVEPRPKDVKPEALPKAPDPAVLVRLARLEWNRGAYLAGLISNPTYRNEMLYKVAESEASGSASVANRYIDDPDPAKPDPANAKRRQTYQTAADDELVDSFAVADKIERPIWRYRAMVRIALQAADSRQYERGFELARKIDNAESRTEALLLIADSLCRHEQNDRATPVYEQAARAAASIQQEGLRGVITGFLIDSLISAGRFDDARACLVIYPEESQRFVALGAIAESQGRRGAAESARRWIASDVPAAYRPTLYRRVVDGYLKAIEPNRGEAFGK